MATIPGEPGQLSELQALYLGENHLSFKSRPYVLLWLGQAISSMGNALFSIALTWQVLLMTHPGIAMGLVLLAGSIPQLFFLFLAHNYLYQFRTNLCAESTYGLAETESRAQNEPHETDEHYRSIVQVGDSQRPIAPGLVR